MITIRDWKNAAPLFYSTKYNEEELNNLFLKYEETRDNDLYQELVLKLIPLAVKAGCGVKYFNPDEFSVIYSSKIHLFIAKFISEEFPIVQNLSENSNPLEDNIKNVLSFSQYMKKSFGRYLYRNKRNFKAVSQLAEFVQKNSQHFKIYKNIRTNAYVKNITIKESASQYYNQEIQAINITKAELEYIATIYFLTCTKPPIESINSLYTEEHPYNIETSKYDNKIYLKLLRIAYKEIDWETREASLLQLLVFTGNREPITLEEFGEIQGRTKAWASSLYLHKIVPKFRAYFRKHGYLE